MSTLLVYIHVPIKAKNQTQVEKAVNAFANTLIRIERASKIVGEIDLATRVICELHSIMMACNFLSKERGDGTNE